MFSTSREQFSLTMSKRAPCRQPAKMFRAGGGVKLLWPNGDWEKDSEMPTSEKDRLAAEAMDRWEEFQDSLSSEKRRYPIQKFRAFCLAATRYAELTKSDSL